MMGGKKSNSEAFEDGFGLFQEHTRVHECEIHLSVEDSRLSRYKHFVCFGRAVSLPLFVLPQKPLAGFELTCLALTERMLDRQADRYTDWLRQTVR